MFDRSLLADAIFEFVVVADTHFMLEPGSSVEFESRRQQTDRAAVALELIQSLQPSLVFHLGDLVQEYPDSSDFPVAMAAAQAQLQKFGVVARQVAGNHDVGDKPDPTMPTRPVTAKSLDQYHDRFGRSWFSFDMPGCHFVVLNSQIMNTELAEAAEQAEWFEEDLIQNQNKRIFVLLHLPPYLSNDEEPALGHYDNIDQPARSWLLDLVRRYRVELLLAAHVHCSFFDRIEACRYFIANSTSFTRPGFCHMFASGPPADQGRDDRDKLGFYLCRVRDERTDIHFVRTGGATEVDSPLGNGTRRILTRTSATMSESPLGITLAHPLSHVTEIPLAWPSAIRQTVRNDYPLLSCLELGASCVRLPYRDLLEPFLARRISILREEGVRIIGTCIWDRQLDLTSQVSGAIDQLDGLELQLPGSSMIDKNRLGQLARIPSNDVEISLSAIIPGDRLPGKQHPRTRHGFLADELPGLDRLLSEAGVWVDRVLCRLSPEPSLGESVLQLSRSGPSRSIGAVDGQLELLHQDDQAASEDVAEALLAVSRLSGARLYIDPLIDFDRTMDVRHGLLDTLCNPRPAFHVLRNLNSIVTASQQQFQLILPGQASDKIDLDDVGLARVYQLSQGLVTDTDGQFPDHIKEISEPILIARGPEN